MTNFRNRFLRVLQAAVVSFFIIVPFIRTSNGNSLIRFDIPTLKLLLFGQIVSFDNFFTLSLFIILIVFLTILVTQIFGRVWCGWICPQSICSDIIVKVSSLFKNKKIRKIADIKWSFLAALIFSTLCISYFVSPYDFIKTLRGDGGNVMLTIWIVLFVALFVDFAFIRYKWCKNICPYSKFQFLMSDDNTLYIGMKHGEDSKCIECLACVKSCPVSIDPRKTPDGVCIYCENCIKACDKILQKRGGQSIIGYNWGNSNKFQAGRVNLIITFAVTVLFTILFLYNYIANKPLMFVIESVKIGDNNTAEIKANIENNHVATVLINFHSFNGAEILEPQYIVLGMKNKKEITLKVKLPENGSKSIKLKAVNDKGNEIINNINLK